MGYDVVLIHPPAIYDFREKVIFPGPIALTVSDSTSQFITPSVGMLSIADYLDRNGYEVMVDNLGERMIESQSFDAKEYIKNLSSKVFAIGLHWCVHSQGAIEVARLCKNLHPNSIVILGGLTATVFHHQIISKYNFVDIIIRGEAEKSFLLLMEALKNNKQLKTVPNLTYRDSAGQININPLMEPSIDLDEFEFTSLKLIEPKRSIFPANMPSRWSIPVCRGCLYNCVTCGGSEYSYKHYLGRRKPAFRSPQKIVKDIQKLSEQGIQRVFLFQDPRMGGKEYWSKLITIMQNEKLKLHQLSMELFGAADEEYLKEISKIGVFVTLTISPESGVDLVRSGNGRNYTKEDLLRTINICKEYDIPIQIFSMIALPEDTAETIRETWEMWEQICSINLRNEGGKGSLYSFGPMILLDPGSLAFDFPEKYGYRLIFKDFADYIQGMSLPSWHQWISYETKFLNRDLITKLIIDSLEYSINLRGRYGLYGKSTVDVLHHNHVNANRIIIDVVNQAMSLNEYDKMKRLRSLKKYLGIVYN